MKDNIVRTRVVNLSFQGEQKLIVYVVSEKAYYLLYCNSWIFLTRLKGS